MQLGVRCRRQRCGMRTAAATVHNPRHGVWLHLDVLRTVDRTTYHLLQVDIACTWPLQASETDAVDIDTAAPVLVGVIRDEASCAVPHENAARLRDGHRNRSSGRSATTVTHDCTAAKLLLLPFSSFWLSEEQNTTGTRHRRGLPRQDLEQENGKP